MMPGADGYQVCRQIRGDPLLQDLPVLFLTAKAKDEDKIEGFRAGADDYLVKPFALAENRKKEGVKTLPSGLQYRIVAEGSGKTPKSTDTVTVHYDPMLAKIITSGESRDLALQRMRRALRSLSVQGLTTNRDFLLRVLDHPAFIAGEIDTHFIERHFGDGLLSAPSESDENRAAVVAALAEQQRGDRERELVPGVPRLVGDRLVTVEDRGAARLDVGLHLSRALEHEAARHILHPDAK